ncbi:hypothetical protein ACFY4C_41170 [Actinomadura viridis]|uniref:hypothetical protein n=1 Tax=Actinomadura viridis TaxID=58110 RepID=UPI0036BB93EE
MTTSAKTTRKMSPERRRLHNLARFWQQRYDACGGDHGELARVSFDRARAAATRAQREGRRPQAMYELAEVLNAWAEQAEQAGKRHAS